MPKDNTVGGVIVEANLEEEIPPCPPGLINITKRYFEATNIPQIAMCKKDGFLHSLLIDSHVKYRLVHKFRWTHKGSSVAEAFLLSIEKGLAVFQGNRFHIRHGVPSLSKYITFR